MMIAFALVSANWFILLAGTATILVAIFARAPEEEAMLINEFGDAYRTYMQHTGRILPRLH